MMKSEIGLENGENLVLDGEYGWRDGGAQDPSLRFSFSRTDFLSGSEGTVARYISGSSKRPDSIEITFIWRRSIMPDETTRQGALKAFQDALADVVDWTTAVYDEGTVFMHA